MSLGSRFDSLEETGGNLRFLQAILTEVPLTAESRILEIGCGTGALGGFMSAAVGAEVYGIELSAELAVIAGNRIQCFHSPEGNIPEALDLFHLIYCKDMLMMVTDKKKFFRSIRLRLRDGGAFCTYMPAEYDYQKKPLFSFVPCSLGTSRVSYGSLENNLDLLKQAGFKTVRTIRLLLSSIQMNESYVRRHRDGYFSNSDLHAYEPERSAGLGALLSVANSLEDFGILAHYEWERTMVVAQ